MSSQTTQPTDQVLKPRDIEHLKKALLLAYGCDGKPLLSDAVAEERARAIWEEIHLLGFDLQLSRWPHPPQNLYPAYKLNDPRYDLNTIGFGEKDTFAINAPGLSHGDLLKLGRALDMKRKHLPIIWPKKLRDHLLDHESHLDTVEELCWLDRWHGVQNVAATSVNPSTGKDIDWSFTACGIPIGIDVKHRRKEWTGILDQSHKSRLYDSWFDDFKGKFFRSPDGPLNLACISTFLVADDDLRARSEVFLDTNPEMDGVVVYSSHVNQRGAALTIFAPAHIKSQIATLLKPLPHEETAKVLIIQHLTRNNSGGVADSIDVSLANKGLL